MFCLIINPFGNSPIFARVQNTKKNILLCIYTSHVIRQNSLQLSLYFYIDNSSYFTRPHSSTYFTFYRLCKQFWFVAMQTKRTWWIYFPCIKSICVSSSVLVRNTQPRFKYQYLLVILSFVGALNITRLGWRARRM